MPMETTRKEFTLTKEQYDILKEVSRPVPYFRTNAGKFPEPQRDINWVWNEIGNEVGFDSNSVDIISDDKKGNVVFSAVTKEKGSENKYCFCDNCCSRFEDKEKLDIHMIDC